MKLCWFIPDDRGGGVASVALSCVRQARAAGHDAVLLMMREPSGWMDGVPGLRIATLGLNADVHETPGMILRWLEENPQDILLLNGGEQADPVIPCLPNTVRCLYVVHDTAPRFWETALAAEADLDGVVAVSQTVSDKFMSRVKDPSKLRVIHNGSFFPPLPNLEAVRSDDLLFLGGDNPMKGAYDVLELWPALLKSGFSGRLHWFGALATGFERRIQALPFSERVVRPGRKRRDDVFAAAAEAKVLLMLSRVEPFGMATIEAMGMGCLPVAWDIPTGTKEIIGAEARFFVRLGDFKTLSSEVLRACEEHALLVSSSTRRARMLFSEEAMWQRYADLLADISRRPCPCRSRAGQVPPDFVLPLRYFQLLPAPVRKFVRELIGRSPGVGYLLRDFRGW